MAAISRYQVCDFRSENRYLSRIDEIDIYRSAKFFIDQYRADASVHAGMKMDAMLERGDLDGVATWHRILKAIDELQATAGHTKH